MGNSTRHNDKSLVLQISHFACVGVCVCKCKYNLYSALASASGRNCLNTLLLLGRLYADTQHAALRRVAAKKRSTHINHGPKVSLGWQRSYNIGCQMPMPMLMPIRCDSMPIQRFQFCFGFGCRSGAVDKWKMCEYDSYLINNVGEPWGGKGLG